jgi:hypothetical protein
MKKPGAMLLLFIFLFGVSFKPKTKSFEGTIKYAIDYHSEYGITKYPQDLSVSIKGDIVRIDLSLPFAEMSDVFDCKKKTHLKLCTVDGVKYYVKSALVKPAVTDLVVMAKDSSKTIKDMVCKFGRINTKEVQYVVYAAEKYSISKNITALGSAIPYNLFFPQKEFEGKLILQRDVFDSDGQTTYWTESITETPITDTQILPSMNGYNEVTEEGLNKIIENFIKGMH